MREIASYRREGHLSHPRRWPLTCGDCGALGGTRTPNLLIRRSGHIVQNRPVPVMCWADVPGLSARDGRCPAAWQQYWQQSAGATREPNRISSSGRGGPDQVNLNQPH